TSGASAWTSTSNAAAACWPAAWRGPTPTRAPSRSGRPAPPPPAPSHPPRRIPEQRHALADMRHRLQAALVPALGRRRHAIEAAHGKLEALSPMRVLERGFSLTQRADGHVVTSAGDVRPGERI